MVRKVVAVIGLIVLGFVIFNFDTLSVYIPSFFSGSNSFKQIKRLQRNNTVQISTYEFEFRGSAMEPSFKDRSWCTVDPSAYQSIAPFRGDVVLFIGKSSNGDDLQLVKRIIGLPSERVRISNGSVYINGSLLDEPYLNNPFITISTTEGDFIKEGAEVIIPSDSYFLLGDNRMHSLDSREFGFVRKDGILGKILSCRIP